MTPLSGTVPLAQASKSYYYLFFYYSGFHGILPLRRPSNILFTLSLYHLDGIKFLFAGGKAFTGKGSLCSISI